MLAIILGTTTSRPSTRTPATVTAGQDPVRHQRRQPSPTHQQIARKLPLAGALAQAAIRRWRAARQKERDRRKDGQVPEDIRTEPHTGPAAVAVEPNRDNTQTFTVRLAPHHDPGTQTVQEVTG